MVNVSRGQFCFIRTLNINNMINIYQKRRPNKIMKETKKSTKALKYGLAASVVGQVLVPFSALAEETQTVELDIAQQKNVDVVLTLGDTAVNAANFGTDLKALLNSKGIDSSRINIQAIETKQENLQSSFKWNQNVSSSIGSINIQNNGTKIQMYGNTRNAGFNKIYTDNNTDPTIKEQIMNFSFSLDYGDSFDGAGVLLNTHVENGLMNGYALFFPKSGAARLYKITNWSSSNSLDISTASNAQLLGTLNLGSSGNFSIKTAKDKVTVIKNGVEAGTIALPTHYGWGIGFFSDHYSHNCSVIGQFSLTNISLKKTYAQEFKDLILSPKWNEDTERFVVNLEDKLVPDFNSPSSSGEILTRLLNEEINYVALGTTTNQQQAENFIQRNDGNGTFINNSNYQDSLNKTADYIVEQLNANVQKVTADNPYLIAGSPVQIKTNPEQLATATQNETYPDGRWKLEHDYDFFENDEGQSSLVGSYLPNIPTAFDKPGKYQLSFEDKSVNPEFIFAHRKPVANFGMTYTKGATDVTVTTENLSYDPDNQSAEDKGIAAVEWKWKETTAVAWNDGQLPTNLPLGKNYIVQLKVKDHQGVWSAPFTSYVTTDSAVSTKPVANFALSENNLTVYDTLKTTDTSYDPAGKQITQKEWKVTKGSTVVYTGATPVTSFRSYGAGDYTIALKVKNASGVWSEAYSRAVKVTTDTFAPEIIVNEEEKLQGLNVSATFKDLGGSGLAGSRYAISNSNATPTTGWSEWSNDGFNVDLTENGSYYIHVEAKDNAGNVLKRVLGPYKVEGIKINIEDGKTVETSWNPVEEADSYRLLLYKLNTETNEYESVSFPRSAYSTDYDFTGLTQGETYKLEVYPRTGAVIAEEPAFTREFLVPVTAPVEAPKVENVRATAADSKVTVNWDVLTVDSTDVTSYRVQALVQDPVTKEFRADGNPKTVTTNSVDFEGVVGGKTYKYEVTPLLSNTYNAESAGASNEVTIALPEVEDPEADGMGDITEIPQLDISVSGTTATVTWDVFEGASQYRIQRYVKNADTGLFVKDGFARTSKSNEFVSEGLNAGKEYKFEVVPRIGYVYDTNKAIEGSVTLEAEAPQEVEEVQSSLKNAQVVAKGINTTLHWDPITVDGEEVTQYRIQRYKLNVDTGVYVTDGFARTVSGNSYKDAYNNSTGTFRYDITPKTKTLYLYDKKVTIYNVELTNDDKLKVFFGNAEDQTGTYNVQRFVKGEDGSFAADGEKFSVTSTTFEDTTADPTKEYKYTFVQ